MQLDRLRRLLQFGDTDEEQHQTMRDDLKARRATLAPPKLPDLEWAAQPLSDWKRIWRAATLRERKDMVQALLHRVTVDKQEHCLELQIEPKAELGRLFRLVRHTGAMGVASACGVTVRLRLNDAVGWHGDRQMAADL